MVAGLLITMGTLGDRIGRRRLLLIGAAAFGAASVLAAFSTSAEMLIAARALLGIAGATLAPSTLSLIRNMFRDDRQRTVAIGIWVTSFSVGAAIGPLVGGALLEFFWWGSVFLVAVPVMALLLTLGPRLLPEFRDPEAGRLDLFSAALSLVGVLAVIYGLKRIAQDGLDETAALFIAAGLAAGVVFVRRQGLLRYPLIDLRMFRAPAFSTAVAAMYTAVFVMAGIELFAAQYLQLVLGKGPFEAGLLTLPPTGGLVIGAMLAPLAARRAGPGLVVAVGLAVAAAGVAALTQVEVASGAALIVAGTAVMGLGVGCVATLATDLIVAAAPPKRAGSASAISETGSELGGALGIAFLGSIGAAVYRGEVDEGIPSAVPADAALAAGDTLGGAVEAAAELPGRLGAELLATANGAFVQGLELAASITAACVLALALVAGVLLREVRPDSESQGLSGNGPGAGGS